MPEILAKNKDKDKFEKVTCEDVGGGVIALNTTAQLTAGDITVDPGRVQEDSEKATPYSDEDAAELSTDVHGRLWIAGHNLADAVKQADDAVETYDYNGDGTVNYIAWTSSKWDTITGSTVEVRETFAYSGGNVTSITRTVSIS